MGDCMIDKQDTIGARKKDTPLFTIKIKVVRVQDLDTNSYDEGIQSLWTKSKQSLMP